MTREEANKELERAFDVLDHTCHMDNRRKEAFNMARVALSAEPCEDAISRQQAIDKMQELEDEDDEMFGCSIPEGFDGKRAIEALKTLPSIQPKPKTDTLDKIRDEIEHKAHSGQWSDATMYGMLKAVAIVDKYTAEKK